MTKRKIVILGAGLAGLSAAYHLQKMGLDYQLFEKEDSVGGLCRSKHIDGFTFDYTGHLLYFRNNYTFDLLKGLINGDFTQHQRDSWIYSFNRFTRYPFQANSFGLPPQISKDCLFGLINAKYSKGSNGCSFKLKNQGLTPFEDWIFHTFGDGIARHFMIPYNTKFWTVPPSQLTCEWIDGYIPIPTLEDALEGALTESEKKFGYNALFWYPLNGGIEEIPLALAKRIKDVNTSSEAVRIDIINKVVEFEDGGKEGFDRLISTIPLPEIPNLINDLPKKITSAFKRLRYTSIFNLNLGVDRADLPDKHWIYFPEEDFIFYRVGFPHNFSSHLTPPGRSSLYVEGSYSANKPIDKSNIVLRIKEDLRKVGILTQSDRICLEDINDIKYGYPIYDINYRRSREKILRFLAQNNIIPCGRYGSWRYMSMEDVVLDGKIVADKLLDKNEFSR